MIILEWVDILGYKPYLTTFAQERYKSKVGKVIGLVAFTAIITLACYFTLQLIQKSELTLIYNESSSIATTINMKKSPMMVGFVDTLNRPVDERFYEIRINYWNFTKVNPEDKSNTLRQYEIPLETCNISKHYGEYGSYFESAMNVSMFKCIPYDQYDINLFGRFGDTRQFSYLNIVVNYCNNRTTGNKCPDRSLLEAPLRNNLLAFAFLDNEMDHYNFSTPISSALRTEVFPINWDIHSRYFYYIRSILYTTDQGFVFEDKKTEEIYAFASKEQTVSIRHGSAIYPQTIGTLIVTRDTKIGFFFRTYPKIQHILAKIGGVMEGIMAMGYALAYLVTKNLFLVDIINYTIDSSQKYKKKVYNFNNSKNDGASAVSRFFNEVGQSGVSNIVPK
jgi:hypothetical protein